MAVAHFPTRNMTDEEQIVAILEQILETDSDPAVACMDRPDLLSKVRRRLGRVRRVEHKLEELFPSSTESGESFTGPDRPASSRLPTVAGYDVGGILGRGGMGVVYKARHQKLNRLVALKMLRDGQFATSDELLRFSREYQSIAELHCPHIVQVYDVGDFDGRPFFTMEFVEGGSLYDRLNGVPQSARGSAEMVLSLAEAIHSAHSKGIIHRDLKPANILLSLDGIPKIADFGLARHVQCDHRITVTGMQLGTPSYMSPEQTIGVFDSVGPSVDIYALGAILYEMLTGRPPFRAETILETQRQVINVDPVPPARINASVPRDLETICLKCLNKQPSRRYATAGELANDLQRFLRHEPIHARTVSRSERTLRWVRRNPAITALAISAMALIGLAVAFGFREYAASEQRQAETEKWQQRLEFVNRLEEEGRFTEAREILGRIPDGGSDSLRRHIQQAQVELELAEQLDAIQMTRGKFGRGSSIDGHEPSRRYEAAFREAGIGSPGDNPAQAADRVKASTVKVALVAALDDWAVCEIAESRSWILDVARRADPNPWRDKVRDQQNWANFEHLQNLSETAAVDQHPVTLLVTIGTRWRRLGGDPTEYLHRVHRSHPDDFWLNFELALVHASDDPISLSYSYAALAIRPDAAAVHYNLGVGLRRMGRLEEANFHFKRVFELDPNHSLAE